MTLLYTVIGIWIGMVINVPMYRKIKDLEEGMKDCIKSGLIGSQEKDMD